MWDLLFWDEENGVMVPSIRPPTPWANRPNSLAHDVLHSSLYFGCRINFLYSNILPVSVSKTALTIWMTLFIVSIVSPLLRERVDIAGGASFVMTPVSKAAISLAHRSGGGVAVVLVGLELDGSSAFGTLGDECSLLSVNISTFTLGDPLPLLMLMLFLREGKILSCVGSFLSGVNGLSR